MTQLSENLKPSNKYHISNQYEIHNSTKDSFHVVIYYINSHKIEIIIRKLNQNNGWTHDLKVKIYDNQENDFFMLSLGSSDENSKIIEIYTKCSVSKKEHKKLQFIPRKIIQTNKEICSNMYHYNSVLSIIEKNPSYEYQFFDDASARKFIQQNANQILKNEGSMSDIIRAYDLIIPGAIKADLFRYCYLYLHGGIYIDSKNSIFYDIDDIISENDKFVLCRDDALYSIYNGFMIMEKENKKLLQVIKECVENILENKYLSDIHEPTGNKLLFKHFDVNLCKLTKDKNLIYYENNLIMDSKYLNYYNVNYDDFRINYVNRNYYYKNIIYAANDYVFMFYNYNHVDEFMIFNLKDNLFVIKRTDEETGWGMLIRMKVFDPAQNKYIEKEIEPSEENEIVFNI